MSSFDERRRITRANYHINCKIKYDDSYIDCKIINFSLTGLLVSVNNLNIFGVGNTVSLFLDNFSYEDSISEIRGEIVRKEENAMALKFSAIDYDTLMKLKELLSHLISDKDRVDDELIKIFEDK